MTAEELRNAIKAMLAAHPHVSTSSVGHATHAEQFVTSKGAPIGFEPARVKLQNLLVRADSVRASALKDISSTFHDHSKFVVSKPNHNLFAEPAFKNADLICFHVKDLWQAVRVIAEAAGVGNTK